MELKKTNSIVRGFKKSALFLLAGGVVLIVSSHPALAETTTTATSIPNPLGVNNINDFGARIIKAILGIVGILALLVIIYGGIEMLTSAGNEERITRGRTALMWAFIGLLVIFGSYAILSAVLRALGGESLV